MLMLAHIWIKSRCAVADIYELQFFHFGQFSKSLVDGSKRDAGHLFAGYFKQRLGSRMTLVVVQQVEQKLALRGELQLFLTKHLGKFSWRAHDNENI